MTRLSAKQIALKEIEDRRSRAVKRHMEDMAMLFDQIVAPFNMIELMEGPAGEPGSPVDFICAVDGVLNNFVSLDFTVTPDGVQFPG
jgi:hypothetical protein